MFTRTIQGIRQEQGVSLSRCCRLFGVSRQAIYQAQSRAENRAKELDQIKPLVQSIRMEMPQIGTRKLYYLLKADFEQLNIKIGRDALFDYLRSEHLLINPKNNYTKITNSKHWLRKHPNLMKEVKPKPAEQFIVSDITYIKSRKKTHFLSLVTDALAERINGIIKQVFLIEKVILVKN